MDVYGLRAEFAHATGVCKWREPASFGGQLYSYYLCEFLKAEAAREHCFNKSRSNGAQGGEPLLECVAVWKRLELGACFWSWTGISWYNNVWGMDTP